MPEHSDAARSAALMPVPSNFHVEVNANEMTVTVTGLVRADDVIEVIRAHYPAFRGRRILWDMISAELPEVGPEDFASIAAETRENTPPDVTRKTAYAVSDRAAYLVIWKYLNHVMRVRVPVEYHAFTDLPSARRWLVSA